MSRVEIVSELSNIIRFSVDKQILIHNLKNLLNKLEKGDV